MTIIASRKHAKIATYLNLELRETQKKTVCYYITYTKIKHFTCFVIKNSKYIHQYTDMKHSSPPDGLMLSFNYIQISPLY